MKDIIAAFRYLKARMKEGSSWLGIVGAVTAASYLTFPWDVVAALAGTIAVLLPEPGKKA